MKASPEMRDWITGRLDPVEAFGEPGAVHHSDFDLNPDMAPERDGTLVQAAVLVPLIERPEGLSVLLTRRASSMRRHSGQVAFPGGRMDAGESPWQAALREAEEEIALDRRHVTLAGQSTPYRTGTGYLVTPVVGFVSPGLSLTASPSEVAHIFETPFGYLMDPANHERRHYDLPDGQRRHFYAMTWEDELIWGATAGMLRALYDRLFGASPA